MIFIVGGKGLTGSALVSYLKNHDTEFKIIQRETKEEFFGKECDVLIYANGNALKYKANAEPYFDFIASTSSIAEYVHKIKYKKFVLLSTIDVYNKTNLEKFSSEDIKINPKELSVYGYHKWLGENYVKRFCKEFLIFRLSGLVGIGLKKNPVYDFINKGKKVMTSPNSEMNFINTNKVADAVFEILKKNISNEVAGQADILLVPNLETGNSLSKIMVYFMGACAAGFIVGGKVPVVITSRSDEAQARLASIAAAVVLNVALPVVVKPIVVVPPATVTVFMLKPPLLSRKLINSSIQLFV